jgi:hypothetical protein
MGHVHSGSEYDFTADAIIVHNKKILLLLRELQLRPFKKVQEI